MSPFVLEDKDLVLVSKLQLLPEAGASFEQSDPRLWSVGDCNRDLRLVLGFFLVYLGFFFLFVL